MTAPKVSIVILNYFHPEVIEVCLRTLADTEGVDYEVIVVDNASDKETVARLMGFQTAGWIDKLILASENLMFVANNLGVQAADPHTEYVLLLNSDVAFLRGDWLTKAVEWMEGVPEYSPAIWASKPSVPSPGPRDILSIGWSHDGAVEPSHARPEGWCCMIRRSVWVDISPDFPWHYGLEEAISIAVRNGAKIGVLFNYAPYLVHREGGSGKSHMTNILNKRTPDIPGWFNGLDIETLDFTLGPDEHSSYLNW